jgi:hypothetical protein
MESTLEVKTYTGSTFVIIETGKNATVGNVCRWITFKCGYINIMTYTSDLREYLRVNTILCVKTHNINRKDFTDILFN